jgi:hypothetical protein
VNLGWSKMKAMSDTIQCNQIKEELLRSMASLFSDEVKIPLLMALRESFPDLNTAFILDWIPEQGEDIYDVFVDCENIAIVDISRITDENKASPLISIFSIDEYRKQRRISKLLRRKLSCAVELMANIKVEYSPKYDI